MTSFVRSSGFASPLSGALASLVIGSTGCSVEGGTATDTGTLDTAPIDGGAVDGGAVDAHFVPDGAADDARDECTGHLECAAASYCSTGSCVACDADGDGFFSDLAPAPRCADASLAPGDCDDARATVSPLARPDCTTPELEACPLGFSLPPGSGTVTEVGLSPEHTLFRTGATRLASGRIAIAIGDDAPRTIDGLPGGVVLVHAQGESMRSVVTLPWALDGGGASFSLVAGDFDVSDFAFGRYVESPAALRFGLLAVGGSGLSAYSFHSFTSADSLAYFPPTSLPATTTFYGPDGGSAQTAAAIADSGDTGGGVAIVGPSGAGMSGTPTLTTLSPDVGTVTGGASVRPGTWLAGEGAALMWVADDTHVAIWNGTESGVSPPLVDLSGYLGGTPSREISLDHRGAVAVSRAAGLESFLAAVVIADATAAPGGTIVILRWSYERPTAPTTRTSDTIPSAVSIHELAVAPGFDPRGGVALLMIGETAVLAHLEGREVVLRSLPVGAPPVGAMEDAPRLPMLRLGAEQLLRGVALDTGQYAADGVARIGVAAVLGDTTGDEVRTRAIEACITP